jgi:hypothetical protein
MEDEHYFQLVSRSGCLERWNWAESGRGLSESVLTQIWSSSLGSEIIHRISVCSWDLDSNSSFNPLIPQGIEAKASGSFCGEASQQYDITSSASFSHMILGVYILASYTVRCLGCPNRSIPLCVIQKYFWLTYTGVARSSAEVKKGGAIPPLPHTYSWCR